MIVTIDGPAGSGKSSAARQLARRLGFYFLDTGAMYRAVALAGDREGIDWHDPDQLAGVAEAVNIELTEDHVLLNGQDVTTEIRTSKITRLTRHAADHPRVREILSQSQQQWARGRDVVTEGRDQATVVFPNAECKIYLTADEQVRAERRFQDLRSRGEEVTFEEVLEDQRARDQQDLERKIGGLRRAEDSIVLQTDSLTPEQVVDQLEAIVRSKQHS